MDWKTKRTGCQQRPGVLLALRFTDHMPVAERDQPSQYGLPVCAEGDSCFRSQSLDENGNQIEQEIF